MERFVEGLLRKFGKRTIAITFALIIVLTALPIIWLSASGKETVCGLEEHTHAAECYELLCTIPEGEQYGVHAHGADCFAETLVCDCAEGAEHTEKCYASRQMCTLTEGADVSLGEHAHAAACYLLVCGKTEHTHTEECEPEKKNTKNNTVTDTDLAVDNTVTNSAQVSEPEKLPMPMAGGNVELSVNAVWDYGADAKNENIVFGSDEAATIEHDNKLESETVSVRISAVYPDGAVNKKLTITLKPGLIWFINGEADIPDTSLKSVSSLKNQTKIYGENLGDGSYIYEFVDGVENMNVDIMVQKTILTNFPEISDAIVVEASCDNHGTTEKASASLKTLRPEQVEIVQVVNNKQSAYAKPDETVFIVGSPFVINTYTSSSGKYHKRLYDYIEFTIEAPSDITLVTAANSHPGTSVGTSAINGWMLKSQETNGNVTTYVFRIENRCTYIAGITPEWIIPYENYSENDKVVVNAKKVEWKLYGDDEIHFRNGTGSHTYTVVDPNKRNEIVTAKTYNHALQYRADSPDAVYQLTGWALQNEGTDPSAPKIVDFEFNTEKIGVTGVTMIMPKGEKINTVWYKLVGDTEWRTGTVNASTTGALGNYLVTNIALGLNEDDYFAAFRYELDFNHKNDTPSDTSDDFRYGIPALTASTGKSGVYVPIAGVNLGLTKEGESVTSYVRVYDKTAEGENVVSDTGKTALKTTFSTKAYNYLYMVNGQSVTASAGTTIHLTAKLSAYYRTSTGFAYCVGFAHYPVLYIRDETGGGISNVTLVNSSGVDILSKYADYVTVEYSHTETEDFNGDGKLARVYKIDTSPLAALSLKEDRYAAAIGFFSADAKKNELTLSYTITPPSTYNDGQKLHYMSDAIMVSDASITSATNRNSDLGFADPYDVNADGETSGIAVMKPSEAIVKNYYMILARADISVSASTKKPSDSEYTKWDGSENYFQVEPNSDFNVNFGIFNGSGNPTSIEPDKITYVYIPIPVKGDEWGALNSGIDKEGNKISEFAYTAGLTGAIPNPNSEVFEIGYANIDTSAFSASTDISVIGTTIRKSTITWGAYSPNANCIRIALRGMPSSIIPEDFVQTFAVNSSEASKGETNIYSALYFEDITDDQGRRYTGWFKSDGVAIEITWGEIFGRVWIDANGNGLQDADEKGLADAEITLVGDKSYSAKTNANGRYSFTDIPLGEYSVQFAPDLVKYSLSAKNVGSSDKIDSDAELDGTTAVITDVVIPFADSMGKPSYKAENFDAGLVPYVNVEYSWSGDVPSGAVLPSDEKLTAGEKYTAEAIAAAEGYTFDGWYTDAALSSKFVGGTEIISDTVLYGKWTINEYTIIFDTKGGSAIAPITQNYGSEVTAPADPTRMGYTFKGWDTEIPEKMPAKDIVITAEWEINEYTITFDTKGGSAIDPITQNYDTDVTAPADPTREGYTFRGWDTEIPEKMPAKDMVITAEWEINQYTIIFDTKGGSAIAPITQNYDTEVTAPADPTREGYTFKGWDTEIPEKMPAKDMVITAEWEVNQYTIIFDTRGGSAIDPITQNYDTDVTAPADPTREGYTFKGWDIEIPEKMPAKDMTITAQWEINEYTITFDTKGGSVIDPITQNYDTDVTAPADPTREGYTFKGWDTEIPEKMPAKDMTITAQWEINRYNIDFSFVGDIPESAGLPESKEVDYNTEYSAENPADVEGWLFDGWYTDEECTRKFTAVAVKEDITLYGRWIDNSITVSGTKTWVDVPEGLTVPDVTIELLQGETVVDTLLLESGETEYRFEGVAKYAEVGGEALEYIVSEKEVANYIASYSEPVIDEEGNIVVDITNTGDFVYSSLTISNKVFGEDAPADAEFIYTVTFESDVEYPYTGSYTGTISSGDTIILRDGESITISELLVGVKFTVEQNKVENFVTAPSSGKIEGVIASTAAIAEFTNKFELPPVGNLTITNKVTGNKADTSLKFPFKVEFDAEGIYELRIFAASESGTASSAAGMLGRISITSVTGANAIVSTIKSGDTVELAHGETAIIYGLPANISYKVTETDTKGYKMTSTGASGTIAEDGSKASFINEKSTVVAGSSSSVPDTGDKGAEQAAFCVMQLAIATMLLCVCGMKKSKRESESDLEYDLF